MIILYAVLHIKNQPSIGCNDPVLPGVFGYTCCGEESTFKDGRQNAMKVNEANLLKSGFSSLDIQKIKNNTENYGGSMSDTIEDLANRFVIAMFVVVGCLAVFVLLVLFGSTESLFAGSIGLLCAIAVAIFVQPPMLAYKSWRYKKINRS